MKCPNCQSENPKAKNFCGDCGHKLTSSSTSSSEAPSIDEKIDKIQKYLPKGLTEKILAQRGKIEGERKQVTVLFADVANYTPMSEKLDPEEVHQIMDGCFKILMNEIHKYEGTINQFTGDGVMAQDTAQSELLFLKRVSKFEVRF
jgi:class 3 adenylate cyclase